MSAQLLTGLDAAPCDAGSNPATAASLSAPSMVVGLVGMELVWPASCPAALSCDRRDAVEQFLEGAVEGGGLKLIEGRAGTGKSYTLAAVREAHEAAGYRVVGLAPTNAVAQDLKADGFTEAGTIHAALFGIKNGRTS